jgi:predicted nucleic acid-binding protein
LTGREPYFALLLPLFKRIQRGEVTVIVSAITEGELLVRPEREEDEEAIERIGDLLSEDGFHVVAVDRRSARLAARLRAQHGLGLVDAIIVSTALMNGCEAVVSNDGKWRRVTEVPIVNLDELVEGA